MIYNCEKIDNLNDLKSRKDQVAIFNRKSPKGFNIFLENLCVSPFSVGGIVYKNTAKEDIKKILSPQIFKRLKKNEFYKNWVLDMSNICKLFCNFKDEKSISFWLGTQRGCKRYHVDMVPFRLLVTYVGQGTELLPDHAANRKAFLEGKPNEEIVEKKSALKYLNSWDIAIFRGGKYGMLHRSPDSALNANSSILMRLDESSFINDVRRVNGY
jgi:hypothetical protein